MDTEYTFTGWLSAVFTSALLLLGSPLTTAWAAGCAAFVLWAVTSLMPHNYALIMALVHLPATWNQLTTACVFFITLFVIGTIRKFI